MNDILRVQLYGVEAGILRPAVERFPNLILVHEHPDTVICYGGDGTLLHAELKWPGVPKVPILNSKRGHRCIPHPPEDVVAGLSQGSLVRNDYMKLAGVLRRQGEPDKALLALNEFNVHMGRINSAVRFQLWLDGEPYDDGLEVLGDGFVISTPFGSTAYFSQITHGIFTTGIGIAFKYTREHINHLVLPDTTEARVLITRGPAVLAFDSAPEYLTLEEGDELEVRKHEEGAIILTCSPVKRLDEPF